VPDVVLVTGRVMPHGPAVENQILVDALAQRGLEAVIEPWGSPESMSARLVVVRTTWDYTDNLPEFLGWLRAAAAATSVVNPAEIIEWNAHKSYLLDLAYAAVPVMPTELVAHGASAAEQHEVLEEYDGPVVIKPAVSVGAIGAIRAAAASETAAAHLRGLVESGDALIQPFEPGVAEGEVSLMYFGGDYSHAVRKIPADGDYRVQVFYGGLVEPHVASDVERQVAEVALAAVPAELAYARVDLVPTSRGPVLMELELIEPQLFLDEPGEPAAAFADHLASIATGDAG
jgi:glutathione synthase/RimK-type ligase-like ATP-grasp enzyme